jgi:HD-GYP domain-containing protein (c-di-GMP phosphodiesterase class II)
MACALYKKEKKLKRVIDYYDKVFYNSHMQQKLIPIILDYISRIANERDVDKLLTLFADMGRDLIGADRCTLWLLDEKNMELWSRVSHGLKEIRIPLSHGIAGYVARNGEPEVINDPYADDRFDKEVDKKTGYTTRSIIALPIRTSEGKIIGVFQAVNKLTQEKGFTEQDKEHLLIAATYTGKQLEAVLLQEEIENTQREIIHTLAETGELRSKETGYHVKRVAEYTYLLGRLYGMEEKEASMLKLASPLHDIGKIAIPDAILLKPGKLTEKERKQMESHTTLGYEMLKYSERRLLKAASIVAHEHHEKWNGEGYPRGVKGEDIHLYGRITAIADVFDALSNKRVYKQAWSIDDILELFRKERGVHFEPRLIDLFTSNIDQVLTIFHQYQDAEPENSG